MKLPNIKDFLDIRSPSSDLGPSKVPEIDKEDLGPKEVFMTWEKTLSPGDKTVINKRFSRPIVIIGIFVGLLLLVMQEYALILVIGSLIFFIQALPKMLPEDVKYEVSNHGIMIGDTLYYWGKLRRFFFIKKEGVEVLAIDTVMGFPGRIYVHFDAKNKEKIKELLNKYLHYLEEEPTTVLDKAYDGVVKRLNFLEDSETSSDSSIPDKGKKSEKE